MPYVLIIPGNLSSIKTAKVRVQYIQYGETQQATLNKLTLADQTRAGSGMPFIVLKQTSRRTKCWSGPDQLTEYHQFPNGDFLYGCLRRARQLYR